MMKKPIRLFKPTLSESQNNPALNFDLEKVQTGKTSKKSALKIFLNCLKAVLFASIIFVVTILTNIREYLEFFGYYSEIFYFCFSTLFIAFLFLFIIWCYRQNQRVILLTIVLLMLGILPTTKYFMTLFSPTCTGIKLFYYYVSEKFFNIALLAHNDQYYIVAIKAEQALVVFFMVFSLIMFLRTVIIKQTPVLHTKFKKLSSLRFWAAILIAVTIVASFAYSFAHRYYFYNDYNYNISSYRLEAECEKTKKVFQEIDGSMTYQEADAYLHENGFITQSEYEAMPEEDKDTSDYIEEDESAGKTVYFSEMIKDYSMLYKNRIIISDTDTAPITSKSVLLIKNDKTIIGNAKKRNPQGCYEKFLKLSKGDDKKKVLKKFSDAVCFMYQAEYTRSDQDKIETYYFDAINIKKVAPEDPSIYFTLTFKNDELSDGTFYGFGKDKKYHYEELGKVTVK